jgi:hypothetical protein
MNECLCGAALDADNTTGVCAECHWWHRNAEFGGDPVPIGEIVDLRHGLSNAIALLRAVVEDQPTIVFSKTDTGRCLVVFDYNARAVALLKETVPAAMRRWNAAEKFWAVSLDWVGSLALKLRNAGFEIDGLDESNITDWFGCFSAATPTSEEGHRAYVKGMCKTCTAKPHRCGGVECEDCFRKRLTDHYRVKAALADAGLASLPQARAAAHKSKTPIEIDEYELVVVARDYTAAADHVIVARRDLSTAKPPCPICGRRPRGSAVVHVGCRKRLLDALGDRPFLRARGMAFQAGLCTVCMQREHRGDSACEHCHSLIQQIRETADD